MKNHLTLMPRPLARFLKPTLLICLVLVPLACENYQPTPLEVEEIFFPAAPTNLNAKAGAGFIVLTWEYSDTSIVMAYRIYRQRSDQPGFRSVGQTAERNYQDAVVENGKRYDYQVAAVSKAGKEGRHSETIAITPAIYSIILASGVESTNSRHIRISVTAPSGTAFMRFSNDSSFSNASWEAFAANRDWQLSPGDGLKTVYAHFRNSDNQETLEPARGQIYLDTFAAIELIESNGVGRIFKSGDTLHIRLKTNEINGSAEAEIYDPVYSEQNRGATRILLYDDGSHGDAVADDGIYEIDYRIDPGIEVENAFLYGYFTDDAGNIAAKATASERLKINNLPEPVVLYEPGSIAGEVPSISLKWSPNADVDFAYYQLMRSATQVVSLSSTVIAEISNASTTLFVDSGLNPSKQYFYRVYVFDIAGNTVGSNIVEARTSENQPPAAVVLSQPVQDSLALRISWSPSLEQDFASYRIFRSTKTPVDTAEAPIRIISDANTTEYRDRNVTPNVQYYYRIFVYDRYGLGTGSNQVSGRVRP